MTREKQGYQPICKGNQNNVIPPNTGSHVKMEKRIAEQEELLNSTLEENKDIYKKMADLDTALEDCTESLTDARIKIKELEKENAELKSGDCWKSCEYANPKAELIGQHIKDVQNLIKAKKLIEKLLIVSCNSEVLIQYPNCKEVLEARVALEQFLREE